MEPESGQFEIQESRFQIHQAIQGWSSALRLSFVASDLGIPSLLPGYYAHPDRFPPAQAKLGRQGNISVIGTQNL